MKEKKASPLSVIPEPPEEEERAKSNLNSDECPCHPDLLLLRDAAIDERNAILEYLTAAQDCCLPELFLHTAQDEMRHYFETMRQINRLDPIQAEAFREVGLDMLTNNRMANNCKKNAPTAVVQQAETAEAAEAALAALPPERRMPTIAALTQALAGELAAANKYQRYMCEAKDARVQALFCHLMNDEKEHIAEFTAALYDMTQEPLTPEI